MAFMTSAVQPSAQPHNEKPADQVGQSSLLSMLILSVYAAQRSNKAFRKLRRRFLWTAFKLKLKSLFSPRRLERDQRIIVYILLGVLALILIFYAPIAALVLAILLLVLILLGVI